MTQAELRQVSLGSEGSLRERTSGNALDARGTSHNHTKFIVVDGMSVIHDGMVTASVAVGAQRGFDMARQQDNPKVVGSAQKWVLRAADRDRYACASGWSLPASAPDVACGSGSWVGKRCDLSPPTGI